MSFEYKKHKCLDPNAGIRCRWGTPTGKYCRVQEFISHPLEICSDTQICEAFGLKDQTKQLFNRRYL